MARQVKNPFDPRRQKSSMSLSERAMATGKSQSRTTGGRGAVPKSTGRSNAGAIDYRDPNAWAKMTGGLKTTTTYSPMTKPTSTVNPRFAGQEVFAVNQQTTRGPSVNLGDLGAAAARDIEAQKEVSRRSREAAQQSIDDVNQQYQEAMSELRGSLEEANANRAMEASKVRDRVSEAYDRAFEYTKQQNEQVESATEEMKQIGADEKDWQRTKFKDTYALRMSTIVDGLRGQLDQDLGMIDEAVAKGQITGRGSMSATEVAQQMKEQTRQSHLDRLASVAADVGDKYNRAEQEMLQSTAAQYNQVLQSATQMEGQTGQQAAATIAQLTDSLARTVPSIEQQIAQADMAALQQEIAIEQLGVRRPELAAEIRLSTAYLPDAVTEYGIWREMYDMQQIATAAENNTPMASSFTSSGQAPTSEGLAALMSGRQGTARSTVTGHVPTTYGQPQRTGSPRV